MKSIDVDLLRKITLCMVIKSFALPANEETEKKISDDIIVELINRDGEDGLFTIDYSNNDMVYLGQVDVIIGRSKRSVTVDYHCDGYNGDLRFEFDSHEVSKAYIESYR